MIKNKCFLKVLVRGGTSLLSDEDSKGIGSLMPFTTSTGIGGYKRHELSKFLTGKKVRVSSFVSTYEEGLKGTAKAKDLEAMFKLIYLNFTSINKDEETYLSVVKKVKESTKNRKLSPERHFYMTINNLRNNGNPRYIDMDKNNNLERLLDSIPYNKLHNTYAERFENAGDFNFLFIGDFDEDLLKSYVETYLASLPSSDKREKYKLSKYKNNLEGERLEVKKGIEDKATLLITFDEEAKGLKEEGSALKIFGQIYKTRLRNKIREEKGGVYTVHTNFKHTKRPYSKHTASISFSCAPKNVDVLEKESLLVLKEFLKEGPSKKEVENIKKNWRLSREKSLEKNNYWFNYMYNKVYWNKTFKELGNYEDKLSILTPKYIKKIANQYLDKPSLVAKLLLEDKEEANDVIKEKGL